MVALGAFGSLGETLPPVDLVALIGGGFGAGASTAILVRKRWGPRERD